MHTLLYFYPLFSILLSILRYLLPFFQYGDKNIKKVTKMLIFFLYRIFEHEIVRHRHETIVSIV